MISIVILLRLLLSRLTRDFNHGVQCEIWPWSILLAPRDYHGKCLMDWRNRESDYSSVDDLYLDENRLLAKSRSNASILNLGGCDVFEETEIELCEGKDSRSFTSVFDRLQLGASGKFNDDIISHFGDRGTQTCDCPNCIESDEPIKGITSRDISSMRVIVQGPEILNYQGIQHSPEDIARYWKKDSRMWLWKSVRLARRKMSESTKTSPIRCPTKPERKELD